MKEYNINENDMKTILNEAINMGIKMEEYSIANNHPISQEIVNKIVSMMIEGKESDIEYNMWINLA